MARIRARNLARDWRLDPQRTLDDLREALELGSRGEPGGIRADEFSLRDIAEECLFDSGGSACGYRFVKDFCNPSQQVDVQEAFTAVDSTAFRGITEQLLIRQVLDSFNMPQFVLSALVRSVPTPFTDGEIMPGMTLPRSPEQDAGADALVVNEAEDYKVLGFGEEWTQMPATVKRGLVIPLTREMLFRDRTGLALRRAAYVGMILGLSKEKRITKCVIGATNNYKEKRKGQLTITSRNTYYSNADSSPPWVNHLDNNDLLDYTALDNLDNLFDDMVDPNTNEPILVGGRQLLHAPARRSTVSRIINSTQTMDVTNSSTRQTWGPNPLRPGIQAFESIWAYKLLQSELSVSASDARGYYVYGDIARAFEYLENWPIEVTRQAPNSDAEFWQDIVTAYKASERGVAAVVEPRLVTRSRAVASSSSGA